MNRCIAIVCFFLSLFLAACPAPIMPDTQPDADHGGESDSASESADNADMGGEVIILVVDDFVDSEEPIVDILQKFEALENAKDAYPAGEGCVIAAEGSGYKAGGVGERPHGKTVWTTFTETLSFEGANQIPGSLNDAAFWNVLSSPTEVQQFKDNGNFVELTQVWETSAGLVRLVPVDIGDFDTSVVTERIVQSLELLESSGIDVSRVVLNMSWVIIPKDDCVPNSVNDYIEVVCSVADRGEAVDLDKLEQLRELLEDKGISNGDSATFDEICGVSYAEDDYGIYQFWDLWLTGILDQAPILEELGISLDSAEKYLDQYLEVDGPLFNFLSRRDGENFISIAAAGNRGEEYPFMPGLWDSVLSVSAEEGLANSLDCQNEFCSNVAEVKHTGLHPSNDFIGSSYAAPRLSLLAAQYLLNGGTNPCGDSPGIHPPLGYMPEDGIPTNSGDWRNLDVDMAASMYCVNFPN